MFGLKKGNSLVFGVEKDYGIHFRGEWVRFAGERTSEVEGGVVFYGYTDYSLYLNRLVPNTGEGDWWNGREPDIMVICEEGQPARIYRWFGGWEFLGEDDGVTVVTHEEFSDAAEMASIGDVFKKEVVA